MRNLLLSLALAATTAPLAAQSIATDPMPAGYRQVQLAALKQQRKTLLAMAEAMPENLYRQKATPAQRTFAEQVQHAAGSAAMIAGGYSSATRARFTFADTAGANGTRAGLMAYVNASYDFAEARLAAQTAADRATTIDVFGNKMPGWQVWDEINQHTYWTAGQIVANFRSNGMTPPPFGFF